MIGTGQVSASEPATILWHSSSSKPTTNFPSIASNDKPYKRNSVVSIDEVSTKVNICVTGKFIINFPGWIFRVKYCQGVKFLELKMNVRTSVCVRCYHVGLSAVVGKKVMKTDSFNNKYIPLECIYLVHSITLFS